MNMLRCNRRNQGTLQRLFSAVRATVPFAVMAATALLVWNLQLRASTIYWLGTTNGSWSQVNNWSSKSMPGSGDNVVFDNGQPGFRYARANNTDNTTAIFNTLTMAGTGAGAGTLSATQTITVSAGSLTINTAGSGITVSTSEGTINANTIGDAGTNYSVTLKALSTGTVSFNAGSQASSIGHNGEILAAGGTVTITGSNWINSTQASITRSSGTLTIGDGGTPTNFKNGILTGAINGNVAYLDDLSIAGPTSSLTATGSGTTTWNNGTNLGTLKTGTGDLTITGSLNNAGGTVSNAGGTTLTNRGTINGGTVAGTITNGTAINAFGTVNGVTVAGGGGLVNFGNVLGTVTNHGELHGTTIGNGGATPTTVTGGLLSGNTSANSGNVTDALNTGTFTTTGGSSIWTRGTNSGTLETGNGNLTIASGTLSNTGTLDGAGPGALKIDTGATVAGGTVSGTIGSLGTLRGVTLTGVTLTGGTLAGYDFATDSNTLKDLVNSGTTEIASGTTTLGGAIENDGSFSIDGGSLLELSGAVTGGGTIINNGGALTVDSSSSVAPPETYTQNSGTLNLGGTLDVSVANLVSGSVTVDGAGRFGTDTTVYNGTANNNGVTLDVGGPTHGTADWIIAGYHQTAGGTIEIDVVSDATHNEDELIVTGPVSLSGDLLLGGYGFTDKWGTKIDLIHSNTPGDLSGFFGAFPALAPGWALVYTGQDVFLENENTPEPAPYLLIGGAIVALGLLRRRRRVAA